MDVNARVCPHCGGNQFMAFIKRGSIVESTGVDENGKPTFKVVKEGGKDNYELEIIRCLSCEELVSESDLISGATCKTCGKIVAPNELDENGNCEVCAMLAKNPDLRNATPAQLLKLLAKAMRGVGAKANLVAKKEEQANSIAEEILGGYTPTEAPQRQRRRRTVRKAVEAPPSEPSEEVQGTQETTPTETENKAEEAVLTQTQDAPFPDVESMMAVAVPPSPPPSTPAQPTNAFPMFENDSEDAEPF